MFNNPIMQNPRDHIMANTWRLIFEHKFEPLKANRQTQSTADFAILEQVLPEYRLIGLSLAGDHSQRRHS